MKKILLVEDELLIALVYERFFSNKGHELVGPFTTGKEAIDNLSNHEYTLALLDIQLEDDIDGIAVAEELRKVSNTPIIFTTGNEIGKTEKLVKHISNTHIIPKPVDFEKVLAILEKN